MAASEGEVLHRPPVYVLNATAGFLLSSCVAALLLMQLLAQATNMQRQAEALEAAAMTVETGSPIFHTRLQL